MLGGTEKIVLTLLKHFAIFSFLSFLAALTLTLHEESPLDQKGFV